jgi:hypothetical protein
VKQANLRIIAGDFTYASYTIKKKKKKFQVEICCFSFGLLKVTQQSKTIFNTTSKE